MKNKIVALSLIRNHDTAELCSVLIGNYFQLVQVVSILDVNDVKNSLSVFKRVRHLKRIVLLVDADSLSRRHLKLTRLYNRRSLADKFSEVRILVVGYQEDQADFPKVWGERSDCSFICKPVTREALVKSGVFA